MKILIVEDNIAELARAVKIATEMGFEVVTATDASVGSKMVCKDVWNQTTNETTYTPLVDGVVTDIFMPYFEKEDWRHNSDSPCGVMVAMAAKAAGLPCCFCTGGYHHGAKFQWIQTMGRYINIGMVDSGSGEEMDAPKKWKEALENVKSSIIC
ncbi:MAG: response regulator [Patescibacteria group bacterium]|nr:response regulator [Patescibacteria group bacterium]